MTLTISNGLSNEFQAAFTDELARVGFDQNYELNPEGQMLEDLIDRFFQP